MIKAPFPYFGGKSRVAHIVWAALGNVPNYVEPFAGSSAVYLNRPHPHKIATLNDIDGFIVNFWRALKHDPEGVAYWAVWPVTECDLTARHIWLVNEARKIDLAARLMGDPEWYDSRIAGYWVYGISAWIGSGWCSGNGPWVVDEEGKLVCVDQKNGVNQKLPSYGRGINRERPYLRSSGQGINRGLPNLRKVGIGVHKKRPYLGNKGINRQLLFWGNQDKKTPCYVPFMAERTEILLDYFNELARILAPARITCGDWKRVCGATSTYMIDLTGVFLDPPYSHDGRVMGLYNHDSCSVAQEVREWCLEMGQRPDMRIVLAGYEGEGHEELEEHGWRVWAWKAGSSYSRKNSSNQKNRLKERLWFSPACIGVQTLF